MRGPSPAARGLVMRGGSGPGKHPETVCGPSGSGEAPGWALTGAPWYGPGLRVARAPARSSGRRGLEGPWVSSGRGVGVRDKQGEREGGGEARGVCRFSARKVRPRAAPAGEARPGPGVGLSRAGPGQSSTEAAPPGRTGRECPPGLGKTCQGDFCGNSGALDPRLEAWGRGLWGFIVFSSGELCSTPAGNYSLDISCIDPAIQYSSAVGYSCQCFLWGKEII